MSGSGANAGIYQATQKQVSNGNAPKKSEVYSLPLTLVAGTVFALDLRPLANLHRIDNIQGIFIDNSQGTAQLAMITDAGQNFTIPAGAQGVMPLYMSSINTISFSGNGVVNITFLNFPTPAAVWSAASAGSVVTVSGLVQVQDAIAEASLATMVPGITPVSGSVVASVVATSTNLFAANAARQYLFIQSAHNLIGNVFYDIWFNPNNGAAGVGLADCIRVPAGGSYESTTKVSTKAITYFDVVGGNEITAFQG